jgi:flagellar basal body-associated protein FliL
MDEEPRFIIIIIMVVVVLLFVVIVVVFGFCFEYFQLRYSKIMRELTKTRRQRLSREPKGPLLFPSASYPWANAGE